MVDPAWHFLSIINIASVEDKGWNIPPNHCQWLSKYALRDFFSRSFFYEFSCDLSNMPSYPSNIMQLRKMSSAANRTRRTRCKRVDAAVQSRKFRGRIRHLIPIRVIISFNDKPRVNYAASQALIVAIADRGDTVSRGSFLSAFWSEICWRS